MHHTADIDSLDVGEVSKDPCASCSGGLGDIYSKVKHRVTNKGCFERTNGACTILLHLQLLLTRNVLPQASVLLRGKENLTTGGVTDSSKVPLHFGWSNTWLRMRRDSL